MANSKENNILEHLKDIRKWKRQGMTDVQLCSVLGISKSTLYKFKSKNKDISDAFKKGTIELCADLRGELVRQALPRTLKTKRRVFRKGEDGTQIEYIEIREEEKDGNLGAIHLLLKNLDPEHWKESWDSFYFRQQEIELKKRELELKEKWHEEEW